MSRVLLVSPEVVRSRMAGPGLRFWNMAKTLAKAGHEVTLAVEDESDLEGQGFDLVVFTASSLRRLVDATEVVITQGWTISNFPALRGEAPLVVDLYDPFHIEVFESYRGEPPAQRQVLADMSLAVIRRQLEEGDFFLCASELQRAFWLGHLALLGRLTPAEHDRDPTFRHLIDVAPFGVDPDPPLAGPHVLKGAVHDIAPDDQVIIWAGGIYDWLDPGTAVRAFARIAPSFPRAHLVFLGARYPNPAAPPAHAASRTRELVAELAVPRVHFHDEWVPFEQRGPMLLEADIGVSAHPDTLEASLAYRTRLLDHLWAGLPTVATAGEEVTERLASAGAGIAVAAGDDEAMAHALARFLADESLRTSAGAAAQGLLADLSWERQLRPLVAFCETPRRAEPALPIRRSRFRRALYLARRLADYARAGQWRMAMNRVRATVQRQGRKTPARRRAAPSRRRLPPM